MSMGALKEKEEKTNEEKTMCSQDQHITGRAKWRREQDSGAAKRRAQHKGAKGRGRVQCQGKNMNRRVRFQWKIYRATVVVGKRLQELSTDAPCAHPVFLVASQ
jgi:hypothetical protein